MTLEEEVAALQSKNKALEDELQKTKGNDDAIGSLQSKIQSLDKDLQLQKEENMRIKLDLSKNEAIKKYPLAAGFSNFLSGVTPQEIEAKAKELHENVQKSNDEVAKKKESEYQAAWGSLPKGTMPGFLSSEDIDTKLKEASNKGDKIGMLRLHMARLAQKMSQGLAQ